MGVSVQAGVKPSPPVASCDALWPLRYWAFRPDTRFELLTFSGAEFAGASSLSGVALGVAQVCGERFAVGMPEYEVPAV